MSHDASAKAAYRRGARNLVVVMAVAAASLTAANRRAGAEDSQEQIRAANERCANRLAISFLGSAASTEQLASADPKQAISTYLKDPAFQDRFARFINKEFNESPGATFMDDASYHLSRLVLESGNPWSDLFLGKYRMVSIASNAAIQYDAGGLGYFRFSEWFERYQGNEPNGIKIATAYRIMNNVVGLHLTASASLPGADLTATGRKAQGCATCHYDNWYALDKVAAVLPLKGQGAGDYKGPAVEILGGKMVNSDAELVAALVESENFSVNACRLSFKYLYGREDNRCEGPLLDKCVDTFKADKKIQSALALIASDQSFCE